MDPRAKEIRAVLAKAGVSNITSVTQKDDCWHVECGSGRAGALHVRTGRLDVTGASAWTVVTALEQLRQPYLSPVVGSCELHDGELAVVSRADDGRSLAEVLSWGRQLSPGESAAILHAVSRAAAALRGAVGQVGTVSAERCHVLRNGAVQLLDPAAGVMTTGDERHRLRSKDAESEVTDRDAEDVCQQLHDLACDLGHPRLAAMISEHAPAGCGAIARVLEQTHVMVPPMIARVPRLPGPRASRQHRVGGIEPAAPVLQRVPVTERW